MCVASDTDKEEECEEDRVEIPGKRLTDLASINQQGHKGSHCIAGHGATWKWIVRRRMLYQEPLIHYQLYV